jgi:class 3 adenylate cyclase
MTFPQVKNSVDFSLEVLEAVKEDNEKVPEGEKIVLRFAVNVGETRIDAKGDRLGTAVNMTFRVEGLKPESLITDEGGMKKEEMPLVNRILITEPVHKEATAYSEFKTRYIGFFDMKGISGRHKIYQLIGR